MEARQAAYFQRLGVDVWVRRQRPVQADAEAPPPESPEPRPLAQPAPDPSPPGQLVPELLESAQPSLELRAPAQAAPEPRLPGKPAPELREPPQPAPEHRPQATTFAPTDAFQIRCFRHGGVFVALAEDAWPWRRFLFDVARAMNGFAVAEWQELVFDWPQPGTEPAGGDRAFRAFLGHQTRNGERSLICGERILALLDTDIDRVAATNGQIYVPPGAPDADAKKRLWRRIRAL